MTHNVHPRALGRLQVQCSEMLFYTYLPFSLVGSVEIVLPKRLRCFQQIISYAIDDFTTDKFRDHYAYLTAKSLYVTPDYIGGREGWHIDGFSTEDKNYIWSDRLETEFCVQDFDLSDDCDLSMQQMTEQARVGRIRTYGEGVMLALDDRHVHRCPNAPAVMRRTFAKVSFSKDRYDLAGNSRNYGLDYDWPMFERGETRNHPTTQP